MRRTLATAALLVLAASAAADVLHLKGGRKLVGRVEEAGDSVRITLPSGTITLPRAQVERIERADLPEETVARRLASLAADDVAGALALAADAEAAGLPDEAGRALEIAAAAAPSDPRVRAASYRWRTQVRRLPADPEGDAALLAVVGRFGRLHLTEHFRFASDVPREDVRRRGELCESAYRKVHELAERLGIEAKPIDRRLDVLLFSDHAKWLAALRRTPEQMRGLAGLYVGEEQRVYLFDTSTLPEAVELRAEVEASHARLREVEQRLAELEMDERAATPENRERLRASRTSLDAERARIAAFERATEERLERENVASTTHEACHQLAFATGLCRPGQPLWLLEGIATLFEGTSRTSFVVEAVNGVRLKDLRDAWEGGRRTSLEDVVTDDVFTRTGADRAAAYGEAWALTHFLTRRRPEEFARFVREGAALAPVPQSAPARLEDFRRFFGADLAALEREWLADVEALRR